ncbi:hypothetical protein TNCV_3046761 [Trichonephila clavipes]|uniref:Uncharacterized protein n=1 Tax=Trichonephila clavipes TaxID=2585209 RepID=A0A8X6RM10_TRICX|nr:hypothetical protein TNCV_3046761 [Trichonephila clavipes]
MQPLGVGGVDVRDFEVKNCYESSGRDWSARSAPIGGEGVCLKWVIERFNILKDNDGRRKQHSRKFMARREPRVLTLGQS